MATNAYETPAFKKQYKLKSTLSYGSDVLQSPYGITIAKNGDIIVADHKGHKIVIFDSNGNHIKSFGSEGWEEGQLSSPMGVTLDPDQNIYVAEWVSRRASCFNREGTFQRFYRYSDTGLSCPYDVTLNAKGHVLVADAGNSKIEFFEPDGDWLGHSITNIQEQEELKSLNEREAGPTSIHVDMKTGNIIFCDPYNSNMKIYDSERNFIRKIGPQYKTHDGTEKKWEAPFNCALDGAGNIVVSDHGTNEIVGITQQGEFLFEFGGHEQFNGCQGVAMDSDGNLYVVETEGNKITVWG